MVFDALKEKGTPLENQIRNWNQIVHKPYDKVDVDAYTRARQILINGIEMEAWSFKHNLSRISNDEDVLKFLAMTRLIEEQQQTTINWLIPADQTVLETTLGYEQVAVDLTAYLSQVEQDDYIRQVFDFGLLEDFDHLYRYSQMYDVIEGKDPNVILQNNTLVFPGRPTQDHHNDPLLRLRHHYNKDLANPQTKVNILTLLAGEQQTHNFYKEHGMQYGSPTLRKIYAEIGAVEEEHVTQYESLIDPNETLLEKLVLHEFTEVCNYHTFLQDETDPRIKLIWEEFLSYEIEHLKLASKILQKYEGKDAEEVIGTNICEPSHFKQQKKYVEKVLQEQVDLRLTDSEEKGFTRIDLLPVDWSSYDYQEILNAEGSPCEDAVKMSVLTEGRDIVDADDKLLNDEVEILERGLDDVEAPDTFNPRELEQMIFERQR